MYAIIFIVFGLILGSFLSVCIYRIPASREDLANDPFLDEVKGKSPEKDPNHKHSYEIISGINSPKRSLCPTCYEQLYWWHNIPVVSWILLKGKCGFCFTPISARYPLVELLTAVFCVFSFSHFGFTPTGVVVFGFCCSLIVLTFIDIDYYILPNVITFPGIAVGFILAYLNQIWNLFEAPVVADMSQFVWGVTVGGGFLWVFAQLYILIRRKEGLGLGDVKLLAMVGAIFGPNAAFYTMFLGSVFGSIFGLLILSASKRGFSKPFPFGPYLALGAVLYIFWGDQIIEWWLGVLLHSGLIYGA
ncbi:MAG: prepilin peptidase [Bdellovibrionales bacterium]|nr:prepilin peptidase [Bdellovibrionales bacterium]